MESGWDEFSQALEAKIQERILPLEQQLSHQQEIISNLSASLQSILSLLQQKSAEKGEAKHATACKEPEESSNHNGEVHVEDEVKESNQDKEGSS